MRTLSHIAFTVVIISLWLILSSWGATGHRIINQHAPASFPGGMTFLKTSFATILVDSASAADNRKGSDPNESAKHYIDIDNYSMFLTSGKIPMSFDSVKNLYGISFVMNNGILPWATIIAFDSVKACFQRNNFTKAALFAADLGHYVGDGHMPLHITRNYDGQYTSQDGIHSRYETHMINEFSSGIVYSDDPAQYITNVSSYVFTYLYANYKYVDSVLLADNYAVSVAGNYTSNTYYNALWAKTGAFTIKLFKHASWSLANLLYTAWVDAGSPNGVPWLKMDPSCLEQNFPNPFHDITRISFRIMADHENVCLKVYDINGNQVATLAEGEQEHGLHTVTWDARSEPGVYYFVLQSGDAMIARKSVLVK